jgi:hypothetical protein
MWVFEAKKRATDECGRFVSASGEMFTSEGVSQRLGLRKPAEMRHQGVPREAKGYCGNNVAPFRGKTDHKNSNQSVFGGEGATSPSIMPCI